MRIKRSRKLIWEYLGHGFRWNTIWSCLKFTKVGHGITAMLVAVIATGIGIWQDSHALTIAVVFVLVLVAVAVIMNQTFRLSSRPRLQYVQTTNLDGSEAGGIVQGGFMLPGRCVNPVIVQIANAQRDITTHADGVKAVLSFRHADRIDSYGPLQGVWIFIRNNQQREFVNELSIHSGRFEQLALLFVDTMTQKPGNLGDVLVTGSLDTQASYRALKPGRWHVRIDITANNTAPLHLSGDFIINQDNGINCLPDGVPFLRPLGIWA